MVGLTPMTNMKFQGNQVIIFNYAQNKQYYNSLHSCLFVYLPYRCCGSKTVSTSFTNRSVNNRRCKAYLRGCSCFWHHISFPNILRFFWDVAYEKVRNHDSNHLLMPPISIVKWSMQLESILIIKDSINSNANIFTHMVWYMRIHKNLFIIHFNFMKRMGDFKILDSPQRSKTRLDHVYSWYDSPLPCTI